MTATEANILKGNTLYVQIPETLDHQRDLIAIPNQALCQIASNDEMIVVLVVWLHNLDDSSGNDSFTKYTKACSKYLDTTGIEVNLHCIIYFLLTSIHCP